MRKIQQIIIHCSDTPLNKHFTVEDITNWHKERGFRTIGYHYVIYLDGSVHKGREVEEIGAHVEGMNLNSIGICYIGGKGANGFPADTRTAEQKLTLKKLVAELKQKFSKASVHGHYEFSPKKCPCFNVKKEFPA